MPPTVDTLIGVGSPCSSWRHPDGSCQFHLAVVVTSRRRCSEFYAHLRTAWGVNFSDILPMSVVAECLRVVLRAVPWVCVERREDPCRDAVTAAQREFH